MQTTAGISKEELLSIMKSVFDSMLEVGIEEGNGHRLNEASGHIALASISITGGWNGVVFMQCPHQLATELGQAMFKTDAAAITSADIQDALGEIINMIGGNVKAHLPGPSSLSLPNVIQGIDCCWDVPGGREVQRLLSKCREKELLLSVIQDCKS